MVWIGLSPTANSVPTSILSWQRNIFGEERRYFRLVFVLSTHSHSLWFMAVCSAQKTFHATATGKLCLPCFRQTASTARTYYRRTSIPGPRVYGHAKNSAVPSPMRTRKLFAEIEKLKGEEGNESNGRKINCPESTRQTVIYSEGKRGPKNKLPKMVAPNSYT